MKHRLQKYLCIFKTYGQYWSRMCIVFDGETQQKTKKQRHCIIFIIQLIYNANCINKNVKIYNSTKMCKLQFLK